MLHRRALLAALTVGDLSPVVHLTTDGSVDVAAVGRQSPTSRTVLDRWATVIESQVFVGRGMSSSPMGQEVEALRGRTLALGWSRSGLLTRVGEDGVAVSDPRTGQVASAEDWPLVSTAAVGEEGVVGIPASGGGEVALWGAINGGAPVRLSGPGPGSGGLVAISGNRVVTVNAEGRVALLGPDRGRAEVLGQIADSASAVAATRSSRGCGEPNRRGSRPGLER